MPNFDTGPSTLDDVGRLEYNGVTFSALFETNVSGKVVRDEANRTTKYMEYALVADGYATLLDGAVDIGPMMATLRQFLTAQAGELIYRGRGFDLIVNAGGAADAAARAASVQDVAWGPVPELLEFQPLGAGRSAKVRWKVVTRVPEVRAGFLRRLLLQLNYETTVSYGEDGYSSVSIRGTMEVPMTRPTQANRLVTATVDDFRFALEERILLGIDLTRFRPTRRDIKVSRDKRTMEWDFQLEERPYMDLPPGCTMARGSYTVRPMKVGRFASGLVTWHCNLKATYTVRADAPRRVAWFAFLSLLRLRMKQSVRGQVPGLVGGDQNPGPPAAPAGGGNLAADIANGFRLLMAVLAPQVPVGALAGAGVLNVAARPEQIRNAHLLNFEADEGLYLDSKTVTFSAMWLLSSPLSHVLAASGLWTKLPERTADGRNLWAISMRDVSGAESWLANRLDPNADIIVDFGSVG